MNDEPDTPKRGGMSGLMLAHVVCCGGVLLFVTGALTLSVIGAWLSEGGLAWLAAGAAALAVGFWARRRLTSVRGVNSARTIPSDDTGQARRWMTRGANR